MSKSAAVKANEKSKAAKKARNRAQRKTHTTEVVFSDEKVTSFGGMILEHRLAERLGLWRMLAEALPERQGRYGWLDVIKSAVAGLLTGARGTFAAEGVREDEALLEMLGIAGAPEEATFWRALEGLGEMAGQGVLARVQEEWVRRILGVLERRDLLECRGFLPLFADSSLLEGSARREGTKFLRNRKPGLVWTTIFAGPLVAAQAIARQGEGERTLVRRMLPDVVERVLKPLRLQDKALLLADALHGNEPTLRVAEEQGLRYVVGAGGLEEASRVLREQPESQWHDQGGDEKRGWEETAVGLCWIQCGDWPEKRLLVGRRVRHANEMFPVHYGVMTNLRAGDLGATSDEEFARAVWGLYDAKGRMELGYQELLSDLNLHHPPCREHVRNAGFYAVATLAHTLGVAVKLIGARADREKEKRDGVPPRVRVKPRRGMRLWRVRRRLFALPARIRRHAAAPDGRTARRLALCAGAIRAMVRRRLPLLSANARRRPSFPAQVSLADLSPCLRFPLERLEKRFCL